MKHRFSALAASALALAACQQGSQETAANRAGNASATASVAPAPVTPAPPANAATATPPTETTASVPPSYDWSFASHGGSGALDFGDGDPAEGVSLVSLSCLPQTNAVRSAGAETITLRHGQVSVVMAPDREIAVNHPVLRDLQATGTVDLVTNGERRVLAAKPGAGRIAIESFLAYCAVE